MLINTPTAKIKNSEKYMLDCMNGKNSKGEPCSPDNNNYERTVEKTDTERVAPVNVNVILDSGNNITAPNYSDASQSFPQSVYPSSNNYNQYPNPDNYYNNTNYPMQQYQQQPYVVYPPQYTQVQQQIPTQEHIVYVKDLGLYYDINTGTYYDSEGKPITINNTTQGNENLIPTPMVLPTDTTNTEKEGMYYDSVLDRYYYVDSYCNKTYIDENTTNQAIPPSIQTQTEQQTENPIIIDFDEEDLLNKIQTMIKANQPNTTISFDETALMDTIKQAFDNQQIQLFTPDSLDETTLLNNIKSIINEELSKKNMPAVIKANVPATNITENKKIVINNTKDSSCKYECFYPAFK